MFDTFDTKKGSSGSRNGDVQLGHMARMAAEVMSMQCKMAASVLVYLLNGAGGGRIEEQ
jgi:hypothetical protein